MRITDLKNIFTNAYPAYVTLKNGSRLYQLTTAITANSTTTSAPAGSVAITSNSTGRGIWFYSDGTKWQTMVTGAAVKATGAELDTGTDDAKFATAKAIADSGYINKTGIAALTDNSGGAAADGTIGAITTGTPADLAAQAAINTQIRDAIKELATKINAIIAA